MSDSVSPLVTVREALEEIVDAAESLPHRAGAVWRLAREALAVLDSLNGTITIEESDARFVLRALHADVPAADVAEAITLLKSALAARIEEAGKRAQSSDTPFEHPEMEERS